MGFLRRTFLWLCMAGGLALCAGCAATSVLTFAYEQANDGQCITPGCAAGAVIAYAIDKANEGQPTPCYKLNSVDRALSTRCGAYVPGSLLTKDVTASGLPQCPLATAARDPQLWPVIQELRDKGAKPQACRESPLVTLAETLPCPDFAATTPQARDSMRWLAEVDPRAVHHDVIRMLSCPNARAVQLDDVLERWLAQGRLPTRGLPFGVLSALDPTDLGSQLALELEARGHTARAGLGAYAGRLPAGFDQALRDGNFRALDWWLDRAPELANRVPPSQGDQLPWVPLARVITPSYLHQPERQGDLVAYLISRGADPWQALPYDSGKSVVSLARQLRSPSLALLDPPAGTGAEVAASALSSTAVMGGMGGMR